MNTTAATYDSPREQGAQRCTLADLLCAGLVFAGLVAALYGATAAFYFGDDYRFVDLARAGSPISFFMQNHFTGGYSYRPLPLALWWFVDRVSDRAGAHYLTNLILLALCGCAFYALLRAYAYRRAVCVALALLYVWHPISVITTLWVSDIFDLSATAALLGSMAALVRFGDSGRRGLLALALVLFVAACLSKEIAYIGPGIFLLHILASARSSSEHGASIRRAQYGFVAAASVVVLGMLALRALLGVSMGYAHALGAKLLLGGISNFLGNLPRLIAYDLLPRVPGVLLATAALLAIAAFALMARSVLRSGTAAGAMRATLEPMILAPIAAGGAIIALCAIVQAPHTGLAEAVLAGPDGTPSGYFFERYCFLALAGALLVLSAITMLGLHKLGQALGWRQQGDSAQWLLLGIAAALSVACLLRAQRTVSAWVIATQGPVKALFVAAASAANERVAAAATHTQPCQMVFLGSNSPLFQAYAEPAIKALANNPVVDDCIVLTERQPQYSMSGPSADRFYGALNKERPGILGKPVRFNQWLMIPEGARTSRVPLQDSMVFVYSPASRTFHQAPAVMGERAVR